MKSGTRCRAVRSTSWCVNRGWRRGGSGKRPSPASAGRGRRPSGPWIPPTGPTPLESGRRLASRFRFDLFVAAELPARTIAGQLEQLFAQHGAPLVLKRDNGSNLAGGEVDELLDAHGVIALNSPPHYPAYNGAIEYASAN